jgi:hypothetical protein
MPRRSSGGGGGGWRRRRRLNPIYGDAMAATDLIRGAMPWRRMGG